MRLNCNATIDGCSLLFLTSIFIISIIIEGSIRSFGDGFGLEQRILRNFSNSHTNSGLCTNCSIFIDSSSFICDETNAVTNAVACESGTTIGKVIFVISGLGDCKTTRFERFKE